MKKPGISLILKRIAPKIGAKLYLEPEYGFVGYIVFKNGKKSFFRQSAFDINPLGAAMIAKDKGYTSNFLRQFGYNTPPCLTIFNKERNGNLKIKRGVKEGLQFCKKIGFPVIVKPNDKSQGFMVTKARNAREFEDAANAILKKTHVALVEKFYLGSDYRIVVLDNRVISAYQRIPFHVIGDGKKTIMRLIMAKKLESDRLEKDATINPRDKRILANLKQRKVSYKTILPKGRKIMLLDNANLSTGGESVDMTGAIHPHYGKLACRITNDLGLRLAGVDILTKDISKKPDSNHVIIEVNAAPSLDNYALSGKKQQKIVDGLYLKILKALEGDNLWNFPRLFHIF